MIRLVTMWEKPPGALSSLLYLGIAPPGSRVTSPMAESVNIALTLLSEAIWLGGRHAQSCDIKTEKTLHMNM